MLKNLARTIGVSLVAVALSSAALAEDTKAEIGKPAPDFALKDTTGKEIKLSDLKDKVVVIEWFNRDCPVTQACTPTMKELANKYAEKGVVWLAIDSTHNATPDRDAEYAEKNELKYSILLDSDGATGKAYGAKTTPHMFVIHKGTLVYAGALDDGDPKKRGETNYVAAALDSVLADKPVAVSTSKPYGCSVKYKQ